MYKNHLRSIRSKRELIIWIMINLHGGAESVISTTEIRLGSCLRRYVQQRHVGMLQRRGDRSRQRVRCPLAL